MNDTIVAISTALGIGAISIIRLSGEDAISIANSVFKGKDLTQVPDHTINYGKIVENGKEIDEVLVSVMKAPRTFTSEDVVEINCHGGIITSQKILELLIEKGCRLAHPGEFTKRAFLNGRIDLIKADGIIDMINAKSSKMSEMAMNKINGETSNKIRDLREKLTQIITNIEVNIDYPEYYDIEEMTVDKINSSMNDIKNELNNILKMSKDGKIIKNGINVAILGRPNVGKSSLLNSLLDEKKAIVTDIAGTTRDIVEGTITINGILLNIVDTAGIRETENVVEQIGVNKSIEMIDKSDLNILLLNNNEELTEEDKDLLEKIKTKPHIIVINKIDLEKKLVLESNEDIITISAEKKIGLENLRNKIVELFNLEQIETSDMNYITNPEQIAKIKKCVSIASEIEEKLSTTTVDMLEIDIRTIWTLLGEVLGETYDEEILDELFSRFCVGK